MSIADAQGKFNCPKDAKILVGSISTTGPFVHFFNLCKWCEQLSNEILACRGKFWENDERLKQGLIVPANQKAKFTYDFDRPAPGNQWSRFVSGASFADDSAGNPKLARTLATKLFRNCNPNKFQI